MKILIDGSIPSKDITGPEARLWKGLLARVARRLDGHEIFMPDRSPAPSLPDPEGIKTLSAPPGDGNSPAVGDRNLAALCRTAGIDAFLGCGSASAGISVHSLCVVIDPPVPDASGSLPSQIMRQAVVQAEGIIALSPGAADILADHYGIPRDEMVIVPAGGESDQDLSSLAARIADRITSFADRKVSSPPALRRYLEDLKIRAEAILARTRPLEESYRLISAVRKRRDVERAVDAFSRGPYPASLRSCRPAAGERDIERAVEAFYRGHYLTALNSFKSAAKEMRGEAPRYFNMCIAVCFLQIKDYEPAGTLLRRELREYPENVDARDVLDALEALSGEEMAAIALEAPSAMYAEAGQLLEAGRQEEAVELLEDIVAKYPDFDAAHNDLGVLHFSRGNREKALMHLERATMLSPGNREFRANLDALRGSRE